MNKVFLALLLVSTMFAIIHARPSHPLMMSHVEAQQLQRRPPVGVSESAKASVLLLTTTLRVFLPVEFIVQHQDYKGLSFLVSPVSEKGDHSVPNGKLKLLPLMSLIG